MKTKKDSKHRLGSSQSKLTKLLKTSYMKTILLVIIAVGSVVVFWLGLRTVLATEYPLLTVASGSMQPTLNVGDLILVQGVSNFSDLKAGANPVGDIIVFQRPPPSRQDDLIVHRTISKFLGNDGWYFKTQGDNNSGPDPWEVPERLVVGKVIGSVPLIGYLPLYIRTPYGILLIIILILLIILTEFIPVLFKKTSNTEG